MNFIELKHWVHETKKELGNIIFKKIQKVSNDYFIIEVFSKNKGKIYFHIILGKCIFYDKEKPKVEVSPDGFIMKIRKDFSNKIVRIEQFGNERVIIFESDEKNLLIELFSHGNIIITDKNFKIEYALIQKDFGRRKIFKGEIYSTGETFEFPSFEEFINMLDSTNKKDLVRFLSIDLRLGGKFSETILKVLDIEKSRKPKDATKYAKKLYNFIKILFDNIEEYKKAFSVKSINDAFRSSCNAKNGKIKKLKKEKERIKSIIENQKNILMKYEEKANLYRKIGEFLKNYSWLFEEWDKGKIVEKFKDLDINIEVSFFSGSKIKIKMKKEDLDRLI